MSRGCCLSCVGAAAVALLALGGAVFVLDRAFSIFSPADRVALDEVYGADHPVVARLDLSSDYLREVTGRAIGRQPWFVDLLWPHEAYLFIDVTDDRTRNDLTLAISTRRLGSLVVLGFPFEEDVPLGGGYSIANVCLDDRGVLTVLAGGTIEEATLAATENWTAVVERYPLNREHLFELVIDNSAGLGYLALRRLFDASPDAPPEDRPPLDEAEIDELFRLIGALHVRADIHENRALRAVLETRYASETEAGTALPLLQKWLTARKERASQRNATIEGEFVQEGTEITGEFILSDLERV